MFTDSDKSVRVEVARKLVADERERTRAKKPFVSILKETHRVETINVHVDRVPVERATFTDVDRSRCTRTTIEIEVFFARAQTSTTLSRSLL